ncbi:hypothetical protein A5635_15585 [Mycobacterium asiaticum]|uniref:Polymerase nucleotidyl transferase domain-containing protein n=2 Tax=Mycobacterium asiaticum TaxID=1790 RepID=A0A1A3NU88_MYCAS|nr:hypothetical protein A5635_15585 [Mycobacterium asiaticum]
MRSELSTSWADVRGIDVVAFGSLARREYTLASDVDYLVLVADLPEDPAAPREILGQVKDFLKREAEVEGAATKDPGSSQLFGVTAGIYDILNQVGLEDDTNTTHTRRMEILLESVSLLDQDLHSRILNSTLQRYLALSGAPPNRPPRFLINDVLRYWRQITVDYQAKAPTGRREPKAVLRYLKLITTRKNLFASSILPLIAPHGDIEMWDAAYLRDMFSLPPLARLATVTQSAPPEVRDAVASVFRTIDLFVQRTSDAEMRKHFAEIEWDKRGEDAGYNELKQAANDLQMAFETILCEWESVRQRTRRYLLL